MNLFLGGIHSLKVIPLLTMSKARLRTTGNRPTMRSMSGLRARIYPRISWYSVILPFLDPPVEAVMSTVAFRVWMRAAEELISAMSCSAVAALRSAWLIRTRTGRERAHALSIRASKRGASSAVSGLRLMLVKQDPGNYQYIAGSAPIGDRAAVGSHISCVLFQGARKAVAALVVSDKVKIFGPCGVHCRLQRSPPGVGNRTGRQPGTTVRVVRRIELKVGLVDGPVVATSHQRGVDNAGVGRERDAALQAVVIDTGYQRPLFGKRGLLFDYRGQRHEGMQITSGSGLRP